MKSFYIKPDISFGNVVVIGGITDVYPSKIKGVLQHV